VQAAGKQVERLRVACCQPWDWEAPAHTRLAAVLPPSCPQLRLQLLAEYGVDPVTEQVGMGAAGCLVHALGRRMLNVPTHPA